VKKPNVYQKQKWINGSPTINEWHQTALIELKKKRPNEPSSILYALIAHVLQKPKHFPLTQPDYPLSEEHLEQLDLLFNKLVNGYPLAYLIGNQEFYGHKFIVSPDVLIPRPETEFVVDSFFEWISKNPNTQTVADVGTGSGCIGITLLKKYPGINIFATDISFCALQVAVDNSRIHGFRDQFIPINTDLLSGLDLRLDCICANLPYIPTKRLGTIDVTEFEPLVALDGGYQGVELIRRLFYESIGKIRPGGVFILEIDHTQVNIIKRLAHYYYLPSKIDIKKDYAKHPRVIIIQV